MPTSTFPCSCCGGAASCCAAGDCCFADSSTVTLQWSISGQQNHDDCTCPQSMLSGSVPLALEWCTGGSARWSAVTCDDPFYCTGSNRARWYRYRVTYDGGTGTWQVAIDALADANIGEPCAGVLSCALVSGSSDSGDCCGVSEVQSNTNLGCCNLDGSITATWSVSVSNNPCCRDNGQCVNGTGACDGSCGGLP